MKDGIKKDFNDPLVLINWFCRNCHPLLGIPLLFLFACSSPPTLEKQLMGKWTMEKVYEYGNDVSDNHNPNHNRYFQFNPDGTFISDGDPFGRNTGRWTIDQEKSILFIDSDVEDDDSEWNVVMSADSTIWTGIGHPRKENTRLVHRKVQE